MNVYVERIDGRIVGIYAMPQPGLIVEVLPSDNPQVIAFLNPQWSRNPLLNKVRDAREIALNRLMGIGFAAKESNDAETVAAVLAARQGLLNITSAPGVATATNDAELGGALVAAYSSIVAAAPANVVSAFAGFNL